MKLPKVYEPSEYENDIYNLWEKSSAFKPREGGSGKKFSMVAPPPNANGDLHLGHALTNAIQDILARYHRMKGDSTLYLPGADHAGFETWVVYEKKLNNEGKTRFDYSREQLYEQVYKFVQQNKSNFEGQYRALGASFDWSRFMFTLDDQVVDQANSTFKKMWQENLIYRGERLVNYCTFHGTGFADIEVSYKEEQGRLWHIKYPLTDKSGTITVATTRPETMLGDVAVAVHPKDARYKKYIGKTVKLPLTQREIPVLADEMVDKDFGTGAVKITPAHDMNDFEVAERHDLPLVSVISHEGKLTHEVPAPYRNLDVKKAREAVVADLKDLELIEKEEDYAHSVGHCYKCGTVIEPLLREQWFIDMKPLANKAIKALRAGEITFYPAAKRDQAIEYLKNIRDWNISRQIAWGIPIPAFQNIEDPEDWIYDERVKEEKIEIDGKTYRRDPDVFDTWFSSGQWPYVTLDYPESEDFKKFYPLDVMETGFDILYQWVCRMIMLGLYVTGKVPFTSVYLHGLVLDEHGQKMSKSKGNTTNPIEVIDEYGSDALRMGLITGQSAGNNQPFGTPKVVAARNFCNKLWNVARYVEDQLGDAFSYEGKPDPKTVADEWLLSKLQRGIGQITSLIEEFRFAEAYEQLYHLLWDDFADWYIEASKQHLNKSVVAYGLDAILKLAHPFAPFVTETIWQTLSWQGDSMLIVSNWPEPVKGSGKKADEFEEIMKIVSEIRYIKSSLHIKRGPTMYHAGDKFIEEHAGLIKSLTNLEDVKEVKDGVGLHLTSTDRKCWLDVDQGAARHFAEELKQKARAQEQLISKLKQRLENKSYIKNAPKELVDQTKSQLKDAETNLDRLKQEHNRFSSEDI